MLNKQQRETLEYFRKKAGEWELKASGGNQKKVNVVKQRNDYVIKIATADSRIQRTLDVGCGTGDLVLSLASLGLQAVGIDFAAEMIEICKGKAASGLLDRAEFVETSAFNYEPTNLLFDLVSANGFIEYISETELVEFLEKAKSLLHAGGSLVLGSRNRLFNVFSLNEFTRLEMSNGALEDLTREALVFQEAPTIEDAIEELRLIRNKLPLVQDHPVTGVNVATRHQYTPGQLIHLLEEAGYKCLDLHAIHFHAAGPRLAAERAELHTAFAEVMEGCGSDSPYVIPFASSFMLHGIRL